MTQTRFPCTCEPTDCKTYDDGREEIGATTGFGLASEMGYGRIQALDLEQGMNAEKRRTALRQV